MSDYLNNLAARSIGRAEQFRPRLPSLFEPATGRAGSASVPGYVLEDPGVDQFEDAEGSADQGARPLDGPARDRPAKGAMVGPQASELSDEPNPFQQSSIRISSAAQQSLKRETPGEDARWQNGQQQWREDEIKARTAWSRAQEHFDSRTALLEETPDAPASPRTQKSDARLNRSALSMEAPMLDRARNDRRPAEWGMPATAAPVGLADQARDQAQRPVHDLLRPRHSIAEFETADNKPIGRARGPAISPYNEDAAPRERRIVSPGPSIAQPASTIKVTIGRVEVRAIVNDSQPRRPEGVKARPRITLDEYLKQRNGGQR